MQTFTSNSALSEVILPVGAVLSIAPTTVLNARLLPGSLVATPVEMGEGDEFLEIWEDTAPSRCSPLDDF